jgi:hypothetical protein
MCKPEDIISDGEEILCFVNKSLGHQSSYKTQHALLLNQFTVSHLIPIYFTTEYFKTPN